jgi:hypothetical protein
MIVLANNGNATYEEQFGRAWPVASGFAGGGHGVGNRAGDEFCTIYVAEVRKAQINHYRRGLAAARTASMTETNWIGVLMAFGATLDAAWHSMSMPSENG